MRAATASLALLSLLSGSGCARADRHDSAPTLTAETNQADIADVCLRVPTADDMAAAEAAVEALKGTADFTLSPSLRCAPGKRSVHIVQARVKGPLYLAPSFAEPPATVECCYGMNPLHINPSFLAAPISYFGLEGFEQRAGERERQSGHATLHAFGPKMRDDAPVAPTTLRQPGFVLTDSAHVPAQGLCIVLTDIPSLDMYPRPDLFRTDNQIFGCVAKFFGNYDGRVPVTRDERVSLARRPQLPG
jgi:hypothetical protein